MRDIRFDEQVQLARQILQRQLATQTREQVNARIAHLEKIGCPSVAANVRRARDVVFGIDPAAPTPVASAPA